VPETFAPTGETARIAGLNALKTPTLEQVEDRRFQLWVLTLGLLALLAGTLVLFTVLKTVQPPNWIDLRTAQAGLLALIALFCAYAVEKEFELRRLAERLVAEKVLTASLTNRVLKLAALQEASRAMNQILDLDEVLRTILGCAIDLLQARDGSIMMVHGERELRTVCTIGDSAAYGARERFGQGVAGKVAASLEPCLIRGAVLRQKPSPPGAPEPPSSAMCTPLIHRGELLGVLNVNSRRGHDFTAHDLRSLSLFGEQAAAAVANANLYESQRLLASRRQYQALHDGLTNLPNRALFMDRLEHALGRSDRRDDRAAILFVDLDDFKRINDSLGHAAGDEALVAVSRRLRSSLRGEDTVARFGGDEFAILVEGPSPEAGARGTADRVHRDLSRPLDVCGRPVVLHASIGIAVQNAEDSSAAELMREAETALHAAKAEGAGRTRVFDGALHIDALTRLNVETELRGALERGELAVHYQPIFELRGRLLALEALIRWQHPERGMMSASQFVPIALRTRAFEAVDQWVLRSACSMAASFGSHGAAAAGLSVNVNVSPSRLLDPRLLDEVAEVLADTGLDPGRLTLEITESAVLRDLETVASRLTTLRSAGVRIALDDFGTGFSSLSHLHRLPIDTVKIDRVFVDGLVEDNSAAALVEGIVRLAEGLSLEVVAEGIETETQRDLLIELGCTRGQGWLLGKPIPPDELGDFLEKRG